MMGKNGHAIRQGHTQIVILLLQYGGDPALRYNEYNYDILVIDKDTDMKF